MFAFLSELLFSAWPDSSIGGKLKSLNFCRCMRWFVDYIGSVVAVGLSQASVVPMGYLEFQIVRGCVSIFSSRGLVNVPAAVRVRGCACDCGLRWLSVLDMTYYGHCALCLLICSLVFIRGVFYRYGRIKGFTYHNIYLRGRTFHSKLGQFTWRYHLKLIMQSTFQRYVYEYLSSIINI